MIVRGASSSSIWEYENSFYWFSQPDRLGKLLAQYDLYKEVLSIPGDIFELGVFKGASLIRLATFRNLLEGDFSRKIVGFDMFGKFPTENLSSHVDKKFIADFEGECGEGLSISEVQAIIDRKGFKNVYLKGGGIFLLLLRNT
jgi:hypothetical protein